MRITQTTYTTITLFFVCLFLIITDLRIQRNLNNWYLERRLSAKEFMLLNCGVGGDSWESFGLQGDQTSQSEMKSILNIHWKNWCWGWSPVFGHLMWTADSLAKTLMLGKIEGRRRRGWQRIRWLDGITDSMDMSLSKFQEMVKDRATWHAIVHGVTNSWTQLGDWTTTTTN